MNQMAGEMFTSIFERGVDVRHVGIMVNPHEEDEMEAIVEKSPKKAEKTSSDEDKKEPNETHQNMNQPKGETVEDRLTAVKSKTVYS